jgi:hypothetical protein
LTKGCKFPVDPPTRAPVCSVRPDRLHAAGSSCGLASAPWRSSSLAFVRPSSRSLRGVLRADLSGGADLAAGSPRRCAAAQERACHVRGLAEIKMASARLTCIRPCRRACKAMLAGVTPSAGECRFVRVVLVLIFPCARTCVAFVLARKTRLAGTFQQAASAERRPVHAAAGNFRLPQRRRAPDASPLRFARNPATTQRNLARDRPQARQGQIAESVRMPGRSRMDEWAHRLSLRGTVPEVG